MKDPLKVLGVSLIVVCVSIIALGVYLVVFSSDGGNIPVENSKQLTEVCNENI